MEIERKFLVDRIPENLDEYLRLTIEQAYLCRTPVVRVRRQNEEYWLTYKGEGLLKREEYNLPLGKEGYEHLLKKADGNRILKERYVIPEDHGLQIELDIFHGDLKGLVMAEVEFPDEETALAYQKPEWFGEEVTYEEGYHNSHLSLHGIPKALEADR